MVHQVLHERAVSISAATHANRSRRLIKCAKDSGHYPARWGWRGLFRSAWDRVIGRDARRTGSSSRTRRRLQSGVRLKRIGANKIGRGRNRRFSA
jgi:hypothetical protein